MNEITEYSGNPFVKKWSVDSVVGMMERYGPGSRAIIVGVRGSGRVGHAFNVVNQNDVIRFLDGQIGGVANVNDGFRYFLVSMTNKGS